ncbi:MAG: hypothetical protein ACKOZW_13035 [Cyanobium sp.]
MLEDSRNGLEAALAAGLPCLLTLSSLSRQVPPEAFTPALAVLAALAGQGGPVRVVRGPACPDCVVTLSYLQSLLSP